MKYIKKFNEDNEKSIKDWCKELKLLIYEIDDNNIVNCDYNVIINYLKLKEIPIQFGIVYGYFMCSNNELKSLKGCPSKVNKFNCSGNKLKSLEYSPTLVDWFDCSYNELTSLEYCPKKLKDYFNCEHNKLKSLIYGPTEFELGHHISGDGYNCCHNFLLSLEGCPEKIRGYFHCNYNPIYEIYKLFPNHKDYLDSLDYNYLRGDSVIKHRFKEALEEVNIMELPDESKFFYKYI